jgi:hypothetical protein
MNNITADLIMQVQTGELEVDDLTPEQRHQVLAGYKMAAMAFLDDEDTRGLGETILQLLENYDDPFEAAILEAETRGSTYWELEVDSFH